MYTDATIDSHLNREGLSQYLVYYHNSHRIQLTACGNDYARLCILLGIKSVRIYAGVHHLSIKQALEMKQEMLDTLSLDYAGKRGRKPTLAITIISPIDGKELA